MRRALLVALALTALGAGSGRKRPDTDAAAESPIASSDWMRIPGGTFQMGSNEFPQEQPVHAVTVKPFEIGRTEVTNRQYRACVKAGACTDVDKDCLGPAFRGPEQPVVCVAWAQARAFAQWAGGRLPSEAEWEYAARGAGGSARYAWGDEPATCRRAVFGERADALGCGRDSTWPVCSKPLGNTKQGLCDMAGNVWEWTEDWYHDSYEGAPADGSAWTVKPVSSLRADRGGQWDGDAHNLRVSNRDSEDPDIRSERGTGFRVARDLPKP